MAIKNVVFFVIIVFFGFSSANESMEVIINRISENSEFECHQPGIFADPYDCRVFQHCIRLPDHSQISHISSFCGNGMGFDPKSGHCGLKLNGNKCPEVIPQCTNANQMGPLNRNPHFYYTCVNTGDHLEPKVYACPFDYIFDGTTCVDINPEFGVDSQGFCIKKGNFYHPSDCTKYRECSGIGDFPMIQSCGQNKKFIPKMGTCEDFTCENCKQ